MSLFNANALWTDLHGIILGGLFLLAFSGGLMGIYSLRPGWLTVSGFQSLIRRLTAGTWITAALAWLTILTGTYFVYPLYRAVPPQGAKNLAQYPKAYLLTHKNLAVLPQLGEWKEHLGWLLPIVATVVAYVVIRYGPLLIRDERLRRSVLILFSTAFVMAVISAAIGIVLNKVAPVH
jgi:hypothetical protein